MVKQMKQQRGILTNPRYSNNIVRVNSKGVMTIALQNLIIAKRPKKKK